MPAPPRRTSHACCARRRPAGRTSTLLAARGGGLGRAGLRERGLRGCQTGERDAVRRAGHVIQAEPVTERDTLRLAAVLAANPELELRLRAPPTLDSDPHQVAHAAHVECLERILLEDPVFEIERQELPFRVVAREAERRLSQVVRPEGEEVGLLGYLVR